MIIGLGSIQYENLQTLFVDPPPLSTSSTSTNKSLSSGGVAGVYLLDRMTNQGNNKQLERYSLVIGSQILADYIIEIVLN